MLGQKSFLFFKSTHQISNFSPAEFFIVSEGGCSVPVVTLTPWFYFSVSDNPSIPSATSLFVHLHFFSKESNIPLCSFMQGIYKKIKKYARKMIKNYSLSHSWSVFQIVILNQFKHHKENVFDHGIVFNLNIATSWI